MIVVISDLHLQHTNFDHLRWYDGPRLRELRIDRNVSAGALELLLNEISDNVARTHTSQVDLVLAGDVFEILRSPLWLLGGNTIRPTQMPATKGLEDAVLRILDSIHDECREFFEVLARAVKTGGFNYRGNSTLVGAKLVVHYLPGNHDRMVNLFASTRRKVRQMLAVQPEGDSPFPHEILRPKSEGYGVLIRHGHEYEPDNFSGAFDGTTPSDAVYDRPVFGDFVTVDIAMRLPTAFRAHYARELRTAGTLGDRYRAVYAALTEFDDVRPGTLILRYLSTAVGADDDEVVKMLRPILLDACETASADTFFLGEAKRIKRWYLNEAVGAAADLALKELWPAALSGVVGRLAKLGSGEDAHPEQSAATEKALADGLVDLVIAGHTHNPGHASIPGVSNKTAFFLDSGTWRTRIDAGLGDTFGRLRMYTMVFCYNESEIQRDSDNGLQERRRFETWSGHLASDQYGPRTLSTPRKEPICRQDVKLLRCRVEQIDEGKTRNGAELYLRIGVDGADIEFSRDHVHDGDSLPIELVVRADPSLDGELWCWGLEKDLGDSILDRDDPLPWGMDRLDRDVDTGDFAPCVRELRVGDKRGNAYVVEYEVVATPPTPART